MLYIMLYNPFGPARALPTRLPTPLCPWCACLCSAGFIHHQTRQWLCLPHQKSPFLPPPPPPRAAPAPPRRSRAEPLRRSRLEGDASAAAVFKLEGGAGAAATAWRAAQVVVLVELLQRSWNFAKVVVLVELLQRSWRPQRSWTCKRSWKVQDMNRVL